VGVDAGECGSSSAEDTGEENGVADGVARGSWQDVKNENVYTYH